MLGAKPAGFKLDHGATGQSNFRHVFGLRGKSKELGVAEIQSGTSERNGWHIPLHSHKAVGFVQQGMRLVLQRVILQAGDG